MEFKKAFAATLISSALLAAPTMTIAQEAATAAVKTGAAASNAGLVAGLGLGPVAAIPVGVVGGIAAVGVVSANQDSTTGTTGTTGTN